MTLLGNLVWHFPCMGFVPALLSFAVGWLLMLTRIGAPIGRGLVEYGKFCLAPFSYCMISRSHLWIDDKRTPLQSAHALAAGLVYLPVGITLFILAMMPICILCSSVVLAPLAIPLAKSLSTLLWPVDKICVPMSVAEALEARAADYCLEKLEERESGG